MISFSWVEWQGLTPRDLGLSQDEIDPWWHDAMLRIKAGYSRAMKEDMDG